MFDEKFWLAASFGFFVGLIAKFVWPKISASLSEKSKKIAEEIIEAKNLKDEAQELISKSKAIYADSKKEAEKMIEMAEFEANKILQEAKKELQKEIKKSNELAISRIKTEEENSIRIVKTQLIDRIIENLSSELDLSSEQHQKIIEKSIKSIN